MAGWQWPHGSPPPLFDRLVGIELRPRVARLARAALADAATIVEGDARRLAPEPCDAVLFFDLLHMMPYADQARLVGSMAALLTPSGVMLVREADAGAGWRFEAVRAGNRIKALAFGRWRQRFYFRTAPEWTAFFERLGFAVASRGSSGTPANMLFVLFTSPRVWVIAPTLTIRRTTRARPSAPQTRARTPACGRRPDSGL